jgi:hypothetical protein
MEPRTRRTRAVRTAPAQAFRVDALAARNGRHGHKPSSASHGEAFPVHNLAVAHEPSAQAGQVPSGPTASPASTEPAQVAAIQQACERLTTRTGEVQALIRRVERLRYERMIRRIRQVVDRHASKRATMAVISRGDEQLVTMPVRRAWHFPQTPTGVYAGHHPADSQAAIAHLEQLRGRGARYLLIPRTAFWWLDHYRDLDGHLERTATCVFHDEQTCALFALGVGRKRK